MSNKWTVSFKKICRDCEQKARNEIKNLDRPKAIIENRARSAASKASTSFEFMWQQMNYRALVPILRAMMSDEGICLNCTEKFTGESDVHIEHISPPQGAQDWKRLHARNLRLFCASCNRSKSKKNYEQWLDDEEARRIANLRGEEQPSKPVAPTEIQIDMFKF